MIYANLGRQRRHSINITGVIHYNLSHSIKQTHKGRVYSYVFVCMCHVSCIKFVLVTQNSSPPLSHPVPVAQTRHSLLINFFGKKSFAGPCTTEKKICSHQINPLILSCMAYLSLPVYYFGVSHQPHGQIENDDIRLNVFNYDKCAVIDLSSLSSNERPIMTVTLTRISTKTKITQLDCYDVTKNVRGQEDEGGEGCGHRHRSLSTLSGTRYV